jgi:hypothetical protein
MSMSFSNLQTERNKLVNRKQTASPSPNPNSTPSWMCRKTIANRRSDMPQRTEIKIKTKIPKRNHTSTHTYPARLSATQRGGERERERERDRERERERQSCLFPRHLRKYHQTESNSQAPKITTKLI